MRAQGRLQWSALLLAPWLATTALAEAVTIPGARDNTLFEDAAGALSNGAGPVLYAGNNGQDLARRGLVMFDVAAALPAGALIEQATLTLHVSNAPNTTLRAFALHRVLESWGEGTSSTTSGSGVAATTDDATWIHRRWPDALWTDAGGTFVATASGLCQVGDVGFYSWTDSRMADDIRAWLVDPASNQGWLLLGDEATLNTARRFDSRESATSENRPTLVVQFSRNVGVPPEASPAGISLGRATPNPTQGRTAVTFELSRPGHARLEVRDLAGRQIAVLVDAWLSAGRHSAVWQSAGAASGIYFLCLTSQHHEVVARPVIRLK